MLRNFFWPYAHFCGNKILFLEQKFFWSKYIFEEKNLGEKKFFGGKIFFVKKSPPPPMPLLTLIMAQGGLLCIGL